MSNAKPAQSPSSRQNLLLAVLLLLGVGIGALLLLRPNGGTPEADAATASSRVTSGHDTAADTLQPVEVISGFKYSPPLNIRTIGTDQYAIDFEGKDVGWFCFRVTGAAGRTLRFDFERAPVYYWRKMTPLAAPVDRQSADWQTNPWAKPDAWGPVDEVRAEYDRSTRGGTYAFRHTFKSDDELVAVRVPYTRDDLASLLEACRESDLVKIHALGEEGSAPYVLEMRDEALSAEGPLGKANVLIYALGLDKTHDAGWMIDGMVRDLLADEATRRDVLSRANLLLMPDLRNDDPPTDGLRDTNRMHVTATGFETHSSLAAAAFFQKRMVMKGDPIHLAVELMTYQSGWNPHLKLDITSDFYEELAREFHDGVRAALGNRGWTTTPREDTSDNHHSHLAGWLHECFGTLSLCYQLNTNGPGKKLTPGALHADSLPFLNALLSAIAEDRLFDVSDHICRTLSARLDEASTAALSSCSCDNLINCELIYSSSAGASNE